MSFSAALCYGCTHNAVACDLEVLLSQRGRVEVTVKVTGCSERTRQENREQLPKQTQNLDRNEFEM